MPPFDFSVIFPVLLLASWACVLLLVDLFVKRKGVTAFLAALGLAAKVDWKKAGAAGVVTALVTALSRWFLEGTLAPEGRALIVQLH